MTGDSAPLPRRWPDEGAARVPYWVYRDESVYADELERIFGGPTWNYVGLEAEIPDAGDFKRNTIGERPVLMVRAGDGSVTVVSNTCAHRGAQLCQPVLGNCGEAIICPYHQWTYDLKGKLTGVPFRRGVKGKGGMPENFDPADHALRRLRVESLNGVVFASFDQAAPLLADYLGPGMMRYFTRIFDGRGLRVLGYQRQLIRGNWKLYLENIKDPYHAGLLHLFLVSFGLFRVDQKGESLLDESKGHTSFLSRRARKGDHEGTEDVAKYTPDYALTDNRLIAPRKEFPDDVTLSIQSLFPSLIIQQQSNTLALRQVIPRGCGRHELSWTFFGYDDDDEELTTLRLRQANFMGAAGLVSLDDTEVLEFSQAGIAGTETGAAAVLDLGGRDIESTDHLITEAPIRGFYQRYRELMAFD